MKKSECSEKQKAPLKETGDPLESAFPVEKKTQVEKGEKVLSQFAGRRRVRTPRK